MYKFPRLSLLYPALLKKGSFRQPRGLDADQN